MSTDDLEANLAPRTGCAVLAVPIVVTAVLVGGYGSFLVAGVKGRPAQGDVVRLAFTGCDEARPLVEARVALMGLGEPAFEDTSEGFAVTTRLPLDPASAAEIPATLAARGSLVVRAGSGPDDAILATEADVTDSILRLDFTVSPRVGITLDHEVAKAIAAQAEGRSGGTTSVWLDDVRAADRFNGPGIGWDRLDLAPEGDHAQVVRTAAAWAVVLEHGPLPCDLSVTNAPIR